MLISRPTILNLGISALIGCSLARDNGNRRKTVNANGWQNWAHIGVRIPVSEPPTCAMAYRTMTIYHRNRQFTLYLSLTPSPIPRYNVPAADLSRLYTTGTMSPRLALRLRTRAVTPQKSITLAFAIDCDEISRCYSTDKAYLGDVSPTIWKRRLRCVHTSAGKELRICGARSLLAGVSPDRYS